MGGIKFSVHPLFFPFGLYFALTGKIFIFLIYTLSALLHELGHSFIASERGYRLDKIVLMPFGAIVSGEEDLSVKDQTAIALAGPITNLLIAFLFVAFWWIIPESYAFTDVLVEANFALAIVNLLPVFPLDGGRIIYSILAVKRGKDKAKKICKIISVIFAVFLIGLFIASCFYTFNLSFLFFASFVIFGAFGKDKENRYVKLFLPLKKEKLLRGAEYKIFAVDKEISVKRLIKILDSDAINEIVVFDENKEILTLKQGEILNIVKNANIYFPLSKYI